jgi:hypothetical protein
MFVVTFTGPAGKTFAGSAKSTPTAAKMRQAVNLDATFSATLK